MCDYCSAHVDDELLRELSENNVRFITFPPHSSHLFQPLDLVTFGVFKIHMKGKIDANSSLSQTEIITEIMNALEMVTITNNNRSAFKRAGMKIDASLYPKQCGIDVARLMQRIQEANLSASQHNINTNSFGFLNKKYF